MAAFAQDVHQYLVQHGVPQLLDDAARRLIEARPANPAEFLNKALTIAPSLFLPSGQARPSPLRGTTVVCTIGPKSATKEVLGKLLDAGMGVLRMNFSHGQYAWFATLIKTFREALAERPGRYCALALDTKGPEIRTGTMIGGEITISLGAEFVVTTNEEFKDKGTAEKFFVDYSDLPKTIHPGSLIYLDDGLFSAEVLECQPDFVRCKARSTATLADRRKVNLPNTKVTLPAVSDRDRADILFGVEQGIDAIFASFIRTADHVKEIQALLKIHNASHIQVFSKIESQEGVDNFDEILKVTDGVMVARGDLGIEIPLHKVFSTQKSVIRKCNIAGKPVICATQMLESMITNPRPTRAEVTDVGNAIIDGADCVMLSGETAAGSYPVEAVEMMVQICVEAESILDCEAFSAYLKTVTPRPLTSIEAVAASAVTLSFDDNIVLMIVISETGLVQRFIAKYRPKVPVIVVTEKPHIAHQAVFLRDLRPFLVPSLGHSGKDMVFKACEEAKQQGLVKSGQKAVALYDHDLGDNQEDASVISIITIP
jgi:pyruvate kinase